MTNLVKSISITALLMEHDRVASMIKQMHDDYFNLSDTVQFCDVNYVAYGSDRYRYNGFLYGGHDNSANRKKSLESALNRLNAQMWKKLMEESGMKTFMGATQIEQWDDMVREESKMHLLPELTKENIQATFEALSEDKDKIFSRAVVDVFNGLSWDYKTNLPQKFGKRIIINYIRSRKTCDKLNDLEKAFYVLEGREPNDYRQAFGTKLYYDNFMQFVADKHENEYFTAKTFKKGTCHLIFKRLDLVDKLNKIIAVAYPNALPPAK